MDNKKTLRNSLIASMIAMVSSMAIYNYINYLGISTGNEHAAKKEFEMLIKRGELTEQEFKVLEEQSRKNREMDKSDYSDYIEIKSEIRRIGLYFVWLPWFFVALFLKGKDTNLIIYLMIPPLLFAIIGLIGFPELGVIFTGILLSRAAIYLKGYLCNHQDYTN